MNIRKFVHKNRNWLFTAAEIALAGGAVYFAGKGSLKYLQLKDNGDSKAKNLARSYAPAAICFAGFTGLRIFDCIKTNKIQQGYAKALMAAQAFSNAKIEKKDDKPEIVDGAVEDRPALPEYKLFFHQDEIPEIAEWPEGQNHPGHDYFYIPQFGKLFMSSPENVDEAKAKASLQLGSGIEMNANQLFDYLGIARESYAADWYIPDDDHAYGDEPFDFNISPAMLIDDYGNSSLFYCVNFNRQWKNYNIDEERIGLMGKAKRIRKQKAKNKKLKNMAKIREQRRAKIKNWIHQEYSKSQSIDEKMNRIFKEGTELFIKKGDDKDIAQRKALEAISLYLPEGLAIKQEDDRIVVRNIKKD